jgi:lysophospholipase L1-like esterase
MVKITLESVKKLGLLACIIGMALAFTLTGCGGSGDDDDGPADIVCLGDSLTAGMSNMVDDRSNSYPAFLQNKVTVTIANAGVSGNTTAQALDRVNSDVIAKNPKIVVICIGANDFFYSSNADIINGTAMNTISSNLQSILDALDTEGRTIFVAKFYIEANARAMMDKKGITDAGDQTTVINAGDAKFNALTTTNAQLIRIADIWTGVWGVDMSADGIHPTAAGYATMANTIFTKMESELNTLGWVK